jgi:MFS family permease
LLPVLILLGGISDRVGRKPVLLVGLLATLTATILMIISPTVYTLFITRLLQGIGIGLSVGTGTAFLVELIGGPDGATKGAEYAAFTTSLGFGGGALFTTIILLFHSALAPASYWVVAGLTVISIGLVAGLPNYRLSPTASLLRPPFYPPGSLFLGLAIAVGWAVCGLVIAVLPTQLAHFHLAIWSGPALFLVNATGAFCQPIVRKLEARRALQIGFGLLPVGCGLLVLGVWSGIIWLVFLGAAVSGASCYGFTYLGGLAEVARLAGAQRARAVSGYFLFAYLGFGIPSIIIGFLADSIGGLPALLIFFWLVTLTTIILAYILRQQRPAPKVAYAPLTGQD